MMRDESAERASLLSHVATFHVQGGTMSPCCKRPENLTREHQVPQRPGTTVRLCRVCHRRHFVLHAEPGRLGLTIGGAP